MIKDSGNRRQFDSGAVRDMEEGKGRCDLLPAAAILRLARHFEAGAKKYGDRNWEKGIPVHSFIDSAIRHLMKYMDGWTDEDHLCAATWNCACAMWTEEKHPELSDIQNHAVCEEISEEEQLRYAEQEQKRKDAVCVLKDYMSSGSLTPRLRNAIDEILK